MEENLALESLSKNLAKRKSKEIEEIKQIEQEKLSELSKSLNKLLKEELHTIEDDMSSRMKKFQEKLTQSRKKIIEEEKSLIKEIKAQRAEIEEEIEEMSQSLTKIKTKQWLMPTVIAMAVLLGLALGSYGLAQYTSIELQTLNEIEQQTIEAKKNKEKMGSYPLIVKTYNDGIELKKKPDVWQNDKGNWMVQFEKVKRK
jgi:cytochrome c-type biogenesis protein CcmH/NrfG